LKVVQSYFLTGWYKGVYRLRASDNRQNNNFFEI
jgi:hypothetical protein